MNRHLIQPMTREQKEREAALSRELFEIESETVLDILSKKHTPDRLIEAINNASGFAENMAEKFRHPDTPPTACVEGCFWCCYQEVTVMALEAFRIAHFLRKSLSTDAILKVLNRLRKLDKKTREKVSRAGVRVGTPCVFLANKRCIIYSVRPLACAEFTSFNVDDCKRGYHLGFKPGIIIHERARKLVYGAIWKGVLDGLRKALPYANTTPLKLTSAVLYALSKNDSGASWVTGRNPFKS